MKKKTKAKNQTKTKNVDYPS